MTNTTCSVRASLTPMTVPPSAFRCSWRGLTTMPGSTTVVTFVARTRPVFGTTVTFATQAQ